MIFLRYLGDWLYGIWITFTTHPGNSNSEEPDEYPEDANDNCS